VKFRPTGRVLVVAVVVGLLVVGAIALVKHKKAELSKAPQYDVGAMPVRVVAARRGNLVEKRDYLAVVESVRTATVSARLTATIEQVRRDEGDVVRTGDVLVVLDGREIRDDIAAVQAQVKQAGADLAANEARVASLERSVAYWDREAKRDATLAAKGDIPDSEAEGMADKANSLRGDLDAARSKSVAIGHLIDSLSGKKAQLETRLGYCTICSPYDGVVSWRMVDPGDLASPGKTLMVVEDRSQLKLAFDVPQGDLPAVREDLEVKFVSSGVERTAHLSHLFPSLDKARMLRAEANVPSAQAEGLSVGAYVPAAVVLNVRKGVTLVPTSCLVERSKGKQHVFVVKDGTLAHPTVQVLGSSGDSVAVEGVEPGEQIVTSTFLGWARLSAGRKVVVIE